MDSMDILGKAQINYVQNFSQKVTLHRPNSLTKGIAGLFKYKINCGWFAQALNKWGA